MVLDSRKKIKLTIITILLIVIDQITKYLALNFLYENKKVIISNIFELNLHMNTGIAFSIPIRGVIVPIFVLFIFSVIITKYSPKHIRNNPLTDSIIGLIYAGGLSNLIDRFIHGAVVDFISVYTFPVFNIADSYITTAAILIMVFQNKILKDGKKANK